MKQDQNFIFRRNSLSNNGGQAVLEYILLLVIIVALIIGSKTAFSHLGNFMSHYIGDYVVCLMEYGELPSLDVADATQKNHLGGTGKSCDSQYESFSFADGRPSIGSKGSASGAGGGKNNSASGDNKNSAGSADKASNGRKSDSGSGSSADDRFARNRASAGRSSPYTAGAIRRSGSASTADGSDLGNQKVRVIADDEAGLGDSRKAYGAVTRGRTSGGNNKYRAITGTMAAEIEKNAPKKARGPTATIVKISGADENRFGPYKKIFTPPEAKKIPTKEDDNSGFGFGYIIRWLIIAGMILAIIVFFGGQIMNYSNSKE